ncbi:hypothetical protein [Microbacterium luticocti]|uniref:hypothetical protein n=1 Tax=Microbacterium luticocti TaxID=451764 RepID=UPI0003FC1E7E|nr:hypothetical protein [Microbacterium luticocti]
MSEEAIIYDFVSKWVSLAKEYLADAPDVRALYLYGSHERLGRSEQIYSAPLYDQGGIIRLPGDVTGTDSSIAIQRQVLTLMNDDLAEATSAFDAAGIPAPTEYRVYYELPTGKLDVQLSRETRFLGNDDLIQADGVELWLGDRAPRR